MICPITIFLRSTSKEEDGADVFHRKLVNKCRIPGDFVENVVVTLEYLWICERQKRCQLQKRWIYIFT